MSTEDQEASQQFIDRLETPRMQPQDATKPFPEMVDGLPVIHLALVNVATGQYLYHKQTTNAAHAAWLMESYESQAKNEEPGFVFYSGELSPVEHIAAEQSKLTTE